MITKAILPKYRCEWTTDSIVTYDWTIWRLVVHFEEATRISIVVFDFVFINVFVIECVLVCRFSTYRSFVDLLCVFSQ